jgi:RAD51-like protein 2
MADCREVSTLPLAPSVIDLLLRSGFRAIDDLKGMKPTELSQECNISVDIALSVLQCVAKSYTTQNGVEDQKDESNVFTARDFVLKAQTEKPIITFCESLDSMLGGGVFIGQITEFCGVPGVGKTQLGIQLCADVQIPECFGGAAGEAVYIDTEGSFMVERAADMAGIYIYMYISEHTLYTLLILAVMSPLK